MIDSSRKAAGDKAKAVARVHHALNREFMRQRGDMPAQYIQSFLLVAMDEGKSVSEYAHTAGVSKSVMSRHLLDIGERNRHMEKGLGLVQSRPNPMELRKHEYFLTPKGHALLDQLVRLWDMARH
jgi:DNA-binding MarR family transcriptional regulator